MLKLCSIVIVLATLSSCASKPMSVPIVIETPVIHPVFPQPYSVCPVTWEVLDVEGSAKIALSYNDNITAAICAKDKNRYIEQLINLTCYYRKDKSERICTKEKNDQ
jgi:hypothetical protein